MRWRWRSSSEEMSIESKVIGEIVMDPAEGIWTPLPDVRAFVFAAHRELKDVMTLDGMALEDNSSRVSRVYDFYIMRLICPMQQKTVHDSGSYQNYALNSRPHWRKEKYCRFR